MIQDTELDIFDEAIHLRVLILSTITNEVREIIKEYRSSK